MSENTEIEELYRKYGALVFRRCLSVLKNEEAAHDALQEVFYKLLRSAELVADMASPVSYLYTMATNVSLNALARDRRRAMESLVPADEICDEREDPLAAKILLEILSSGLGEKTRAIVYFRYADGMGLDEIAGAVELSRSAVRKHLDRFKKRARRHKERII